MAQKNQKLKFKQEKFIKQRKSDRTGKWSFQVYFEYYDQDGMPETYTSTFAEKDFFSVKEAYLAAIADRDEKRNMLNTTGLPNSNDYTLEEMFYIALDLFTMTYETKRKKLLVFKNHIPNKLKTLSIKKISSADIQQSLNFLANKEAASKNVINSTLSLWRQIYKAALMKDTITIDQTIKVSIPSTHKPIIKKDVTTDSGTIQKVCNAIIKHSRNNDSSLFDAQIIAYAIQLQWLTGIRPAECFALEKKHVDFNKKVLHICQSIGSTDRMVNVIRDTKTQQSLRDIPITLTIENLLSEICDFQDSDFLFANFNGELMNSTFVSNKIRLSCKAEGIEFNMYRCRHQFSTDLIRSGQDLRTIMELMGHNNINMTVDYARSNNELKIQALENRNE